MISVEFLPVSGSDILRVNDQFFINDTQVINNSYFLADSSVRSPGAGGGHDNYQTGTFKFSQWKDGTNLKYQEDAGAFPGPTLVSNGGDLRFSDFYNWAYPGIPNSWMIGGPANQRLSTYMCAGAISELWIAPGQYIDWSTHGNRYKFHTMDQVGSHFLPVDLGATGKAPTGTAPAVYCTGSPAAFPHNRANGHRLRLTGGDHSIEEMSPFPHEGFVTPMFSDDNMIGQD
jgi:hypothetical protein